MATAKQSPKSRKPRKADDVTILSAFDYYRGASTEPNKYLSASLFEQLSSDKAAASLAGFFLGIQYFEGDGVEQNVEKSIKLVKRAKSQIAHYAPRDSLPSRDELMTLITEFLFNNDRVFARVTCHECGAMEQANGMFKFRVELTRTEGSTITEESTYIPSSTTVSYGSSRVSGHMQDSTNGRAGTLYSGSSVGSFYSRTYTPATQIRSESYSTHSSTTEGVVWICYRCARTRMDVYRCALDGKQWAIDTLPSELKSGHFSYSMDGETLILLYRKFRSVKDALSSMNDSNLRRLSNLIGYKKGSEALGYKMAYEARSLLDEEIKKRGFEDVDAFLFGNKKTKKSGEPSTSESFMGLLLLCVGVIGSIALFFSYGLWPALALFIVCTLAFFKLCSSH